jgi:protein-disulfide isomerase
MWRLLSVSALAALALQGATEEDIIKFVKRGLANNPAVKVKEIRVIEKQPLERLPGWETFIVEFDLVVKQGKSEREIKDIDILFAKDRFVAPDLIDVKTNRSLKSRIVLSVDESFYDKAHHLFGNPDAKHKIVVFSDPLCPFCREVVPELFEVAKKYPDTFALYYYHLPIESLHPASVPLAKAIIYLKSQGRKDLIERIYKTEFDYSQRDEKKVLDELNKKLGLNLTTKDINKPEVVQELHDDMKKAQKLMVRGTPTVFFDGRYDMYRKKYKQYIPKESDANETDNRHQGQ